MGNQLSGEPSEVDVGERSANNVIDLDSGHSRPKPVPKSRVRLVPLSGSPSTSLENSTFSDSSRTRNLPQREPQNMPVYHLTPNQRRTANELSEEEQVKIAQRIGLIQHLPKSTWDESQVENKKVRECCICMIDFEDEEPIRYLPCMHYYHVDCIDDWLMRSFTCPTCMEPVDAALLSSYGNHNVAAS